MVQSLAGRGRRLAPSHLMLDVLWRFLMDLGFETCGNATLIAYDRGSPVVVTDPWIRDAQYFGSWMLPYSFSARQMESLRQVRYVWLSHGHPDH